MLKYNKSQRNRVTKNTIKSNLSKKQLINEEKDFLTSKETISQMILDVILDINGIGSNIYGLTGVTLAYNNLTWQKAIDSKKLNYVPVTLECWGVLIAQYQGYINYITNNKEKVGIMTYENGPGAIVPLSQIYNSYFEKTPCIAITGKSMENFDYVDQSIFPGFFKKVYMWDENTINPQQQMRDAFYIALNGTTESPGPGPVFIQVNENSWLKSYKYTKTPKPYFIEKNNFSSFIQKILHNINPNKKILFRIGNEVSKSTIEKLAILSKTYTNIFILLVWNNNNPLNLSLYKNVAREGKMGSSPANSTYSNADIYIEVGLGITLSEFNLLDITHYLPVNTPQYFIMDYKQQYTPYASNNNNTVIGYSSDLFLQEFINALSITQLPLVTWDDISKDINNFYTMKLNELMLQKVKDSHDNSLTIAAHEANILNTLYHLDYNSVSPLVLNTSKKKLYISLDVGLSSFIFDMFCFVDGPEWKITLNDYSPIGNGPAVLSGVLYSYLDVEYAIQIIGDGGQLSTVNIIMDLIIAMKKRIQNGKKIKVLYFLGIDNYYSNVVFDEIQSFGVLTTISETSPILKQINLPSIINAMMGDLLISTLTISNTSKKCMGLTNFIKNWYNDNPNFTQKGSDFIQKGSSDFTQNGIYLVICNSPKYSGWTSFAKYPSSVE